MAAYVEIVFDNSDGDFDSIHNLYQQNCKILYYLISGRLPIESDEVVLRRTVGLSFIVLMNFTNTYI